MCQSDFPMLFLANRSDVIEHLSTVKLPHPVNVGIFLMVVLGCLDLLAWESPDSAHGSKNESNYSEFYTSAMNTVRDVVVEIRV